MGTNTYSLLYLFVPPQLKEWAERTTWGLTLRAATSRVCLSLKRVPIFRNKQDLRKKDNS